MRATAVDISSFRFQKLSNVLAAPAQRRSAPEKQMDGAAAEECAHRRILQVVSVALDDLQRLQLKHPLPSVITSTVGVTAGASAAAALSSFA